MSKHILYTYGTLMTGESEKVQIPGYLYDLGWYPGISLRSPEEGAFVVGEKLTDIDDEKLSNLDRYEGYYPDSPEDSLYLRVPYLDGWIYTYNQDLTGRDRIGSLEGNLFVADWSVYSKESV